jgi:hypothetical protein
MKANKKLHMVTFILVMVGGINWGLVGLGGFLGGNWNLVNMIFGAWPMVEALVYVLVGLSAVYEVVMHKKTCKMCGSSGAM